MMLTKMFPSFDTYLPMVPLLKNVQGSYQTPDSFMFDQIILQYRDVNGPTGEPVLFVPLYNQGNVFFASAPYSVRQTPSAEPGLPVAAYNSVGLIVTFDPKNKSMGYAKFYSGVGLIESSGLSQDQFWTEYPDTVGTDLGSGFTTLLLPVLQTAVLKYLKEKDFAIHSTSPELSPTMLKELGFMFNRQLGLVYFPDLGTQLLGRGLYPNLAPVPEEILNM